MAAATASPPPVIAEASGPNGVQASSTGGTYDMRAFGDFGWTFVNSGEQYRKLVDVSDEDQLMMCGIFKQATMGDCLCEAATAKNSERENKQRDAWLQHKGMDSFDAMKLYIEKVKELALIYSAREEKEAVNGGSESVSKNVVASKS